MKHCRRMIWLPMFALVAILLPATASDAQVEIGAEAPGFHGMLLFGSERIYMSHLPMFMAQHRYQAIWEVSFGDAGDATYRAEAARADNAGGIFTLAPRELFRLPELTTTKESFTADVYLGHFERPGRRKLLDGVTVTLRQAIHWHPFRVGDEPPERLTYLAFGAGEELFLAHWISAAPDYDQILEVTPRAPLGPLPAGAQFVVLERSDGRPLAAGDAISGLMIHRDRQDGPFGVAMVELEVSSRYYLEEGELRSNHLPAPPSL